MQIEENKVVKIEYTVKTEEGVLVDTSEGNEPLAYLHGHKNIIPGLENALVGKAVDDELSVTVTPEEAYGERHEQLIKEVPMQAFQGVDKVEPGMQFNAESPQGPQLITVTKVDGDTVTVDGNHPLAGVTLNFDVKVVEVREPSEEELSHGHVHGAGGHEH
ncbi:FKBP-type peptidyl-prolyl cis-trans isomerase [Kangiella spongicola]|jgi:FKBP-type peptidyl-prolyl cis-trans isomerase SlyD|uniref:Peptidyl-prolyl cis-trans isomerase n=1 Tax=Kangiella spongicola TaxID=796379 RepID=A0A318D5E3_9GAMM|nr:peptidylprolyl isomerase [Kangiella spongicola]MBV35293.1 peptidylprolyl isomerase [Rickettsiales bacterium]PXF64562.1 peptidylprolyl isomerase [Kangiella spongicola]